MKRLARLGALLLILAALAIPASARSAPSALSDVCNDEAWEVLALTNEQRITNGLLPLSVHSTLQKVSNLRADELIELYSHTRPDGTSCFTALGEFGLSYSMVAENIAVGQDSPAEVVTAWMNSEGHRRNILTAELLHAAMGFTYDPNTYYRHHWVQFFQTDFGCSITAMSVIPGENGLTIPAGGTIDDMDAAVELTCAKHGACYLPLIDEMCTVSGNSVTVTYNTLSCRIEVDQAAAENPEQPEEPETPDEPEQPDDPDEPFTVSDDYFTAEVVNGKATITKFYDPYMYWGLTYIQLPDTIAGYPVTGIADGVFSGLYLGEVTLPSTMSEISEGAFRDAEFSSMIFKGQITRVGPSAFEGALFDSLTLPEGVTVIGDNAFKDSRFNTLNLPTSVTVIGNRAFYYCSLRQFPDLPALTEVGYMAFSESAVSGVIRLPATLTTITQYAFSYMPYVTAFEVDPANPYYTSRDGVLYNKDMTTLYNYPIANTRTEYTVPETVRLLYCTSFADVVNLDTLYVTNPSASSMTYTFYRSDFTAVCTGYSPVYAALSKYGRAKIVPYVLSYRDGNRIVFDMSGDFTAAEFYLAAYNADGRMINLQYLDYYHDTVVDVYNADQVAVVKVFQFDYETTAPTAEAMTVWEA